MSNLDSSLDPSIQQGAQLQEVLLMNPLILDRLEIA